MKKCDLVMKGGITSGIVYPGVVCKLAEKYEFQNIGGTSAGGIAAALTAAAELARRQGRNAFPELAQVPAFLGANSKQASGSNLFNLFQPQPAMRGLFHFATAFLLKGFIPIARALLRVLWFETLLAFAFGFLVLRLGWDTSGWQLIGVYVLAFFAFVAGILLTWLAGLLLRLRSLSNHHYGFCFGYTRRTTDKQPISLIEWLNAKLNSFAALPEGQPLTFGDLKNCISAENPNGITLKMITTCLTWGRPFTLPFDTHQFYFSPQELSNYLPADVISWMENHPAALARDDDHGSRKIDLGGLKPLPAAEDLPVILAVRLSLSFPFLFCAVPLYAVDFTRRERPPGQTAPAKRKPGDALGPDEPFTPERVWFADGGITSNFPFHLFDSPIPRWPTFGLDLDDLRPDMTDKSPRTWMPTSNVGGIAPSWTRLETAPSFLGVLPFAFSMINAARNWMDNLQATVPGYRDRIVHVYLNKREGGLNLNMPAEIVTALSGYGEQAAEHLIDHFIDGTDGGKPTIMTWDNQRWIRYRSTTALLQHFVGDYAFGMENPETGDPNIMTLIARGKEDPPPTGYRFSPGQRDVALEVTEEFRKLGDDLKGKDLEEHGPKPEPALRVRPKF
jgi:predicted acylesterase/phospholipase RssA